MTLDVDLSRIEQRVAGRLGVAVLDTESGQSLAYRADERFPMCSTFMWLLAAQVLARIDAGQEQGDRVLAYSGRDILDHLPVSRANLEDSVYGWGEEVGSNSVEVHLHHLRRKLDPALIRNVRGVGYRIAAIE